MEPVGQWPAYAAPYDRRLSSAGDTPSTTPPHLLLPSAYNSVLFNHQSTYQQNSSYSTNNGHYHHSATTSLTASNPYYGTHGNPVLMGHSAAESIPSQLASQFQSSYGHTGAEVATSSSTISTSNSTSYDNYRNHLFGTAPLKSQSFNFNYNDKSSTVQPYAVSMNVPKDNFYPTISHPYEVPNSPVNNRLYNVHETSKKSDIVTPATVSPSSLPSSPLSAQSATSLPASVEVNAQHHRQHQKDHTMALNLMNSQQFQSTSSTTASHQTFDNNSTFTHPINIMNQSKEFQSAELASKAQHLPSVSHAQLQSNILYEHSSKTPAPHTSYQHTMNKNHHHVYNNQTLGECSSPSSPLPVSIVGLPTNLSTNKTPPSDLKAPDQRSSFQTAFDQHASASLTPGHRMPLYNGAEYAASPRQGFQKGRSENMGCYSPCSRQELSPDLCAVTSPLSTHFQTSPQHMNSPSYPSHNSPVTFSSASQPTFKVPNLLDSSALLGETSPQTKDSETNFKQVTHLNHQYYWQDSNHNLQKTDSNYSKHRPSSGSPTSGNTFERNSGTDNSYLHPMVNGKLSTSNSDNYSDPISSITKVTNSIQEKINYLPTGVINLPEKQDQKNSKHPQTDLQSKNSMEQNVSNNGSNPFERSSTGKMKSYDDGNQITFNNSTTDFQNSTSYIVPTASNLPNASSQNRSSNLNQILQGNSQQSYGDSNPYYNSSSLNGNNRINNIDNSSVLQNAVSHYPSSHLPHYSTPNQQQKNTLIAPSNGATHVTKEIFSNTSTQSQAENYAKSSINASLTDERALSASNEIGKTIPSHNVNQSLMVSQFTPPYQTPHDILSLQTHPLNGSQTPPAKLPLISIPTDNSSYCSSSKKNDKSRIVVPSAPVDKSPAVPPPPLNCNQKQKSLRKGRPPKKTEDLPLAKMPEKKPLSFPPSINNGFMASYIKFLEGIQYDSPDEVVPPKREVTTRRAKRKSSIKARILDDDYEDGDDYNSINSDSDPAWSPAATKDDSDEEFDIDQYDGGRKTRSRSVRSSGGQRGRKRGRRSTVSEISSDDEGASKQKKYATRTKSLSQTEDKSNDSSIITDSTETNTSKNVSEAFPFQVGEFVINKTEVNLENPPIWRVDGKTLLQKYEASEHKGEIIYKNIPTYAGWTHLNNDAFQNVQVKIISQNRTETVVQLLNQETKVSVEDQKAIDKLMQDTMKYQDNFEIYIQTLISQALDSNFLGEIIRENDDYFLDSVKAIDGMTSERRKVLIDFANWQESIVEKSMATWPCIDVLQGSPKSDTSKEMCASCKTHPATKRVIVFGQPYNNENLEGCPSDPAVSEHKDFLLCKKCIDVVSLYNKIVHQKYQMFIQCADKVQEKRTSDPTKDTTIILNELLADEQWLSQLFKDVRTNWAQVEKYTK